MTQTTTKSDVVIQILTTNIDRNPHQPRQWFNTEELDNLADFDPATRHYSAAGGCSLRQA